jgi:hypothetical protein
MYKTGLSNQIEFAPESRVWVYVSNRKLNEAEAAFVQDKLNGFARQWTAHDAQLQAAAEVFDRQALVLMVDETRAGASGCSIDKSVHFLESLGNEVGADFFDRMRFGWVDDAGILHWEDRSGFEDRVKTGKISPETLVVNTLAKSKKDLEHMWLVPFRESWHKRIF